MDSMIANMVRELAAAPGDGVTVLLAGADSGYLPWSSSFASGAAVLYAIDGTVGGVRARECGIGTYGASPPSITRGTVLWNSVQGNAAPARLNFAGQVLVYNTVPAEQQVYRKLLPWDLVETRTISSGTAIARFVLPAGAVKCRLELRGVTASTSDAAGLVVVRVSADGATDVTSGYQQAVQRIDHLALPITSISGTGIGLGNGGTMNLFGTLDVAPANGAVFVQMDVCGVLSDGGATRQIGSGYVGGMAGLGGVSLFVQGGSANLLGGGNVRFLVGYR